MIKKILEGLLFGFGFSIALVIIWFVAFYIIVPSYYDNKYGATNDFDNNEINTVPKIESPKRYLGSTGIYSGDFLDKKNGVLAAGSGKIIGKANVNDLPVAGLKLRLALNGKIMSQWATTDANGEYLVKVPYGEYIIDGFELDRESANQVLFNKIRHPRGEHSTQQFNVSENNIGQGINFKFVEPIIKKQGHKKHLTTDEIIFEWEAYPGAYSYSVQVYEKSGPNSYKGNNRLFEWSDKPEVLEPKINLSEYGIEFKSGFYYAIELNAKDEDMHVMSETPRLHSGYDFEITD